MCVCVCIHTHTHTHTQVCKITWLEISSFTSSSMLTSTLPTCLVCMSVGVFGGVCVCASASACVFAMFFLTIFISALEMREDSLEQRRLRAKNSAMAQVCVCVCVCMCVEICTCVCV
jgi:hypothetical protein